MALQGFEARLERMVDGVFSRAFRSSLKPIELGRRLVKEMDTHRTLDVHGRAVVPNVYTFALSPADHHAFSAIEAPLVRELLDAAKEHARDEGYGFLGPLRVELRADDTLRSGRIVLASELSANSRPSVAAAPSPSAEAAAARPAPASPEAEPSAPPAAAPPAAAPPAAAAPAADLAGTEAPAWANQGLTWGGGLEHAESAAAPDAPAAAAAAAPEKRAALLLPTGARCDLQPGATASIGRFPGCDLVVNDPNVSRRHAEVRPRPEGGWSLVDLGSTNGTRVNGASISEHELRDGDVITMGGTRVRFEVR